jgi:hypothetical protein
MAYFCQKEYYLMPEKLIILDPTLEVQTARVERAPRSGQVHILGLLDNGKPNSDRLLNQVALLLREQHPDLQVNYYRKPGAYRPAPTTLLDQVVAECDSVLVGIGD